MWWLGAGLLACGNTAQTRAGSGSTAGSGGSAGDAAAAVGGTAAGSGGRDGAPEGEAGANASGRSSAGAAGASGSSAGACASACTLGEATTCDAGKQSVCLADASGCPALRKVDCICVKPDNCLRVMHQEWGDTDNAGAVGAVFDSVGNLLVPASTIGRLKPLNMAMSGSDVLVKWSPTLDPSWALQLGTAHDGIARAAAIGADDSAYLAGVSDSSPQATGTDGLDIELTKVDSDGQELWTKTYGSALYDDVSALIEDPKGNVFLGGFASAKLDTDPALGKSDAVLIKLSPSGEREWARQFGSNGNDAVQGLCVDGDGNAYVTGSVAGSFAGPFQGGADLFVAKFSSSGEQLWAKQLGGALIDGGTGIACDKDAVYVVGITSGRLDDATAPVPAEPDIVALKYDLGGNQLWLKQWLTTGEERFPKIAVGPAGSVFIAGASTADIDENPDTGFGGETDLFVSEWSPAGQRLWAYQWGSESWDEVMGVSVAGDGRIAVAGRVQKALPGFSIRGTGDAFVSLFARVSKL